MRHLFVLAASVALSVPSTMFAGSGTTVEFVSGTVKSIPANTTGSLDTEGSSELSFHYGKSVFSLPYHSITNTEVTEPSGHHLWKVPVPKIGKNARFLNISYREGENTRMVTFKSNPGTVTAVVNAINDHRKDPKPATAAVKTPSVKTEGETWWGDQYWRTTRNKAKWPQASPENAPGIPAGTKE